MLNALKNLNDKNTEAKEMMGFSPDYRKDVIERTSRFLADLYAVYLKTQKFHWNARGARFRSAHNAFEEVYTVLAERIDDVAERITALDGIAPGSFSEYESLTELKGHSALNSIDEMYHILSTDLEQIAVRNRATVKFADEHEDPVTADLITSVLGDLEKFSWMLRSNQIELRPTK